MPDLWERSASMDDYGHASIMTIALFIDMLTSNLKGYKANIISD